MAQERKCQLQQPTLSRSSSTTFKYVPQIYQQQQPAFTAGKYILIIPETQMPANQDIQPAQQIQVVQEDNSQKQADFILNCRR